MPDDWIRRFGRLSTGPVKVVLLGLMASSLGLPREAQAVFPGATWTFKTPAEVGMDAAKLDQIASMIGGNGCIVRDGYMVKTWGSQSSTGNHWASASKPVFSTLLFFAIEEGKLSGVHDTLLSRGWVMSSKDNAMEYYHVANMISGYTRVEAPGVAWAYNDYGIQLFWKSLFTGGTGSRTPAFSQDANTVANGRLVTPLQMQDGPIFGSTNLVITSVRDFARIGWWWLNKGNWNGTQILPASYFDLYVRPHVPADLPRTTATDPAGDYLGIGTYGGGSDQTPYGPGVYGYTWWFNPSQSVWPDAPEDTFQANGLWNRDTVTIIPSLNVVMACKASFIPSWGPGNPDSGMNQILKLLTESVAPETPLIALNPSQIDRVVDLAENLPDDTFTVNNAGIGTLEYQVTDDAQWLDVDPASGSSTGESDTITVSYAVAGLAVGTHVATIEVSDNGSLPPVPNSPQTIVVTVEVKTVLPDFDGDGDVDQEDFGFLQKCFTASGMTVSPECASADMDGDQLVNQNDFGVFQLCMSGASIWADKTCDDGYN